MVAITVYPMSFGEYYTGQTIGDVFALIYGNIKKRDKCLLLHAVCGLWNECFYLGSASNLISGMNNKIEFAFFEGRVLP